MAWWPSSRGLTGFASAVLRALFDGFDGMVAAARCRPRYQTQREGKHRTLQSDNGSQKQAKADDVKQVSRLNKLTHESAMNGR